MKQMWRLALAGCVGLSCTTACSHGDLPVPSPRRWSADIFLKSDSEMIRGLVPRNTTLDRLLRDLGLTREAVQDVIASAREVFDPRRLRATQPFVLERTRIGEVRRFEYEIDTDTFLRVSAPAVPDQFFAAVLPIPRQRQDAMAAGRISGATPSLYQAMDAAGEQPELTIAMADIFAGEIDFNTGLQPGDRFGLMFEKFTRDDRPSTYGAIAAAEFQNDGRVLRAIRFTPPGGRPGYFDEQGRSLRRLFLRSPLKFEPRITSGFTRRRFHPVLSTARAHLGVDYGAPAGSPVVAVASGSVVSATFDRTNGRMVRLRHAGGYETYYLHLSAFGTGVRAGNHVSQGQVIGLVGSTGLATGPHLDYRLRKNGVFVNPVREHQKMPPGDPVPAAALAEFETHRDRALERLNEAMRTAEPLNPPAPIEAVEPALILH